MFFSRIFLRGNYYTRRGRLVIFSNALTTA